METKSLFQGSMLIACLKIGACAELRVDSLPAHHSVRFHPLLTHWSNHRRKEQVLLASALTALSPLPELLSWISYALLQLLHTNISNCEYTSVSFSYLKGSLLSYLAWFESFPMSACKFNFLLQLPSIYCRGATSTVLHKLLTEVGCFQLAAG